MRDGILSARQIHALHARGGLLCDTPFLPGQIQPASLDLRLGRRAFRMRASFLPGPARSVAACIEQIALHEIDLTRDAVLETGCVYLAEVQEHLALPPNLSASANPKSSTGRIDVFTRIIPDHAAQFDTIPPGYHGRLYAEISPRSFPVTVRTGSRLAQIRFRRGQALVSEADLIALHARQPLVNAPLLAPADGVPVSVDLSGFDARGLIGYRARRHTGLVDVDALQARDMADFWEPIHNHGRGTLVLDPGEFYILASREAVCVPADHAAEMTPFNALVGEFRVHYAGFFDPGFGLAQAGGTGARAVLEVRSRDVPFILEDGQVVAQLVYETMSEIPDVLYGQGQGSHYQAQGLKLSKHFRVPTTMP
jgi:dCTP deaminase